MTNRRGIELFARDYPHDFPEVEAILMVHAHDMSMREVPVTMRPRATRQLVARRPQRPLLHDAGAAGDLRRPLPPPPDPPARRRLAGDRALRGARGATAADRRSLLAVGDTLSTRVQIFAIAGSALLFFFVLELVRRRRLGEPYAILWLLASVVLLILSIFDGLLRELAELVGIATPANALFVVGFGFILVLLLSFSSVVSRLSRENKLLAQELARLNREREEQGDRQDRPVRAHSRVVAGRAPAGTNPAA